MATKPTHYTQDTRLAFLATARPANWRWSEDTQPERLSRVGDYIDLSDEMVKPSFDFVCDVLVKSGHIPEKDRKNIMKRLEKLGADGKLYLDGVTISTRIKSLKACEDKILKDNKYPEEIGDYIGLKLTGKTKDDVVRLRSAILSMQNITSSKCEISYPSAEFYASHKSHHTVENVKHRKLAIEVIITHAEFEIIDQMTHPIMEEERDILRKIAATPVLDVKTRNELKEELEKKIYSRSLWNYNTLVHSGLHELSAPDADIRKVIRDGGPRPKTQDEEHKNIANDIISTIAPAFINRTHYSDNDDHAADKIAPPLSMTPT